MGDPRSKGRMIRRSISKSHKIASLSKESIILFVMMIPHMTSHGKMEGDPHFIKGSIVPLLTWFDVKLIMKCLDEINSKTNLKWFEYNGLYYIHCLNWSEHQDLKEDKKGEDIYPDFSPNINIEDKDLSISISRRELQKYSGSTPELLQSKSGVTPQLPETEVEGQNDSIETWLSALRHNKAYEGIDIDIEFNKMRAWCDVNKKMGSKRRFINWLNRVERPMIEKIKERKKEMVASIDPEFIPMPAEFKELVKGLANRTKMP